MSPGLFTLKYTFFIKKFCYNSSQSPRFVIWVCKRKIFRDYFFLKFSKQRVFQTLEEISPISIAKNYPFKFLLVIFRITRIIRQPLGNALLLGMGGSGRQSLTRLAAHLSDYECFQIELAKNYGIVEWREDIKKVMMQDSVNKSIEE